MTVYFLWMGFFGLFFEVLRRVEYYFYVIPKGLLPKRLHSGIVALLGRVV